MTAVERAKQRYEKLRSELLAMREELLSEVEETRLDEIREAMAKCHADMDAARNDIALFERSDKLIAERQIREDVNIGGTSPSEQRDLSPPTPEFIRERAELQYRQARGQTLTDAETAIAARVLPVENLFARIQWLRAIKRLDKLTHEERDAWRAYQDAHSRAIGGGFDATTPTDGAEFVPTMLEMQIFEHRQFSGPLAMDDYVRVARLDYYANLDIPVSTTVIEATGIAPATDSVQNDGTGADKPDTGEVAFQPKKYKLAIPVSAETMMSPVNFDAWIMTEVADGFGRAYNRQRSFGDGNGTNFRGAWTRGAALSVDTADEIGGNDILRLFGALDYAHFNRPGTQVHMHSSTELDLMRLADGRTADTVAYIRIAPDGTLVLPRGLRPMVNNAFAAKVADNAATDVFIGVGDLGSYGVFYAAGMRAYVEYFSQSDQYLMTFYAWVDGQPIRPAGFARLTNK